MRRWIVMLAVPAILAGHLLWAAGGDLDPTFGVGGILHTSAGGAFSASDVLEQADGKVVAAGSSYGPGDFTSIALVRYGEDGTLDPSFGTGGIVLTLTTPGYASVVTGLVQQADGKLVVTGQANDPSGVHLVRYLPDGSLDATFGSGGTVTTPGASSAALALQPDGKLVVAGSDGDIVVERYLPDGTLDASFGTGGMVTTPVPPDYSGASAVVVRADGKIVIAGWSYNATDYYTAVLVRYEPDGTLDATFGSGGVVVSTFSSYNPVVGLALTPDGKVLITGTVYLPIPPFGFSWPHVYVERYDDDGTLDPTFGTGGFVATYLAPGGVDAVGLVRQPDGRIVVAGSPDASPGCVLFRYDANGSLDPTFGSAGVARTSNGPRISALTRQRNGRLVVAGLFPSTVQVFSPISFGLARYLSGDACGDGLVADGTPCDDGDPCTTSDSCVHSLCGGPPLVCPACEACDEAAAGCVPQPPAPVCRAPVPGRAFVSLHKDALVAARDRLVWRWTHGPDTPQVELGTPTLDDDYALCVYDPSGLILGSRLPAGSGWAPAGTGFVYTSGGAPDGIFRARVQPSGRVFVKGRGAGLGMPALGSLGLPLRVQLQGGDGACWEGTYSTPTASDASHFTARAN